MHCSSSSSSLHSCNPRLFNSARAAAGTLVRGVPLRHLPRPCPRRSLRPAQRPPPFRSRSPAGRRCQANAAPCKRTSAAGVHRQRQLLGSLCPKAQMHATSRAGVSALSCCKVVLHKAAGLDISRAYACMQVSPCSSARLWGEPGQVACRLLIDDRYKRWPVLPNAGHTARSDTAAWYCAQQHAVLAERVQVQPVETSGGRHGHATPVHRQTLQQPDQTVIVSSGFGFPEPPLTVFMQSTCKLAPASTQAVSPVCCSARLLLALLIQTRSPLVQTLPPSSHHSHPPSGQAPGARGLASAQRKKT